MKNLTEECINRMESNEFPEFITQTFKQGVVYCSHPFGFSAPLMEKEKEIVDSYEKRTNNKVFHIIHSFSAFGELYDLLYVSKYIEDWELERESLKEGIPLVYSVNLTCPTNSEYGSIQIEKHDTFFERTA